MGISRSLSVVIPCFNEEGNIAETVNEIKAALAGLVEDYELIVINDSSTDRTRESIVRHQSHRFL